MCGGPVFELPWWTNQWLVWCCSESTIGMSATCRLLQTLFCAMPHAMAFHTTLSHQAALSWLPDICTQPSNDLILLSCWHMTWGFVLLPSQYDLCYVNFGLLSLLVYNRAVLDCGWNIPGKVIGFLATIFADLRSFDPTWWELQDDWHYRGVDCHNITI